LREGGIVVVAAPTPVPSDDAWRALTERDRIAKWLGTLSGDLAPGAQVRLDFGDGDFFDLDVEHVVAPSLRWTWRFMGGAPPNAVELRVDDRDGESVVTVTDRDAGQGRDRDEARGLGEGWRDFTARLQCYLASGEASRYDWRSRIDVAMELPLDAGTARRLIIGDAARWLPLADSAANLIAANALILADDQEPATFAISGLAGTGPASVRFDLRPTGIAGTLDTRIAVAARGDAATLAIRQSGFRALPVDDAARRRLRERFAAAWLAAVQRARALAEGRAADGAQGAAAD